MKTLSRDDRTDIKDLVARYAYTLDLGDHERLLNCFTDDGEIIFEGLPAESPHSGVKRGREALRDVFTMLIQNNAGHVRHWAWTVDITGDDTNAHAVSYFTVIRAGEFPSSGMLLTGIYRDDLIKVAGEWRLTRRSCTMDPQPEHAGLPRDVLISRFDAVADSLR